MRWKAILSDGREIIEGENGWEEIPGLRLPWPRLIESLEPGIYIDKLTIDVDGAKFELPEADFYSIQYKMIADNLLSGSPTVEIVLDACAHFEDRVVHCIVKGGNLTLEAGEPFEALVPSPKRNNG